MKKHYLTMLCCLLAICFLKGQTNLVPNPSFEIHTSCPSTNDITVATSWYSVSYVNPDYFNSCATNSFFAVPHNGVDYQLPASGNAYAGFSVYESLNDPPSQYSEFIGSSLTTTLTIGQKYYIKFKLNCTIGGESNTAIDKIGIRFTMIHHDNNMNWTPINNFAHVYATTIVTDTSNWTVISGAFIADSTYSYIEAGNFFDYQHVNTQILKPWGSSNQSFYFIDDICVSTDSLYTANWTWSGTTTGIDKLNFQEQKTSFYPNPTVDVVTIQSKGEPIEEIKIYDIMGQLVLTYAINSLKNYVINLNDLPPGNYNITIRFKNMAISNQIITKI